MQEHSHIAHLTHAIDQGKQNQGRYEHLQQTQEDIAEEADVGYDIWHCHTNNSAYGNAYQDLDPKGYFF